jgi:hypothetical protein
MFVPVSCTSCGKPFQVPEAAVGKLAPCPWCQAVVTALPVSAPLSEPAPAKPHAANAPAPLSLDDEPPARTIPKAPPAPPPAPPHPAALVTAALGPLPPAAPSPPPPGPRAKSLLPTVFVGVGIVVAVMVVTVVALGYRSGRFTGAGWTEFTAPDGSFGVSLPGTPAEEDLDASPADSLGAGKRYAVRGWYSKTAAWVAYRDLEPALVQKLPADTSRSITAGVLRAERDREVARLKGTVTKEAEVRVGDAWGVELHMDTPDGQVVERLILAGTGPHPRLYAYGVRGKNLTPTSPACTKVLGSFRRNE